MPGRTVGLCDKPSKPGPNIADVLADPEHLEAYRIVAWTDNTKALDHWDEASGDYAYTDGWPEGVDPDDFVAEQLLGTSRPNQRNHQDFPAKSLTTVGPWARSTTNRSALVREPRCRRREEPEAISARDGAAGSL